MSELLENGTIVEVFGEFVILVEGKRVSFDTVGEAEIAVAANAVGEAAHSRASAYCEFLNIDGKNAVGKVKIVAGFLAWEAAGSPVYVAPVVKEVTDEAPTDAPELDLEAATAPDLDDA